MLRTRHDYGQDGDEDVSEHPLCKQRKTANTNTIPESEAIARFVQYQGIDARDNARLRLGDNFYGDVTIQHAALAPAVDVSSHDRERKLFLESLEFAQMDMRHMTVHTHLDGTCDWLLDTLEYKRWMDPGLVSEHHGFLWIKGRAGAGKSTLMKFTCTRAEENCSGNEHVLCFFFNTRGVPLEKSTNGLFRCLLYQMIDKIPEIYSKLDKRLLGIVRRQGWFPAVLKDLFKDAVTRLTGETLTCFVDAMDECLADEVEDIVSFFDDLGDYVSTHTKRFRICLSSRLYPNLKSVRSIEIQLEGQRSHNEDIRVYVEKRLVIDSEQLKKDLLRRIKTKARGVFLWVVLVVQLLNNDDRRGNAHEIYDRLEQIPAELSDLFDDLLKRAPHNQNLRPLLRLLTFSKKPLRFEAMYSALTFENDAVTKKDIVASCFDESTQEKFILDASKGLVEVIWPGYVQFMHESVRAYLTGEGMKHLVGTDDAPPDQRLDLNGYGLNLDGSDIIKARCHNDLKLLCFRYIIYAVKLFTATGISIEEMIQDYHGSTDGRLAFLEYAMHTIYSYAESAHIHGLRQVTFIETLPRMVLDATCCWFDVRSVKLLSDTAMLQRINSSWYDKVCLLVMNQCPTLLESILQHEALSGSDLCRAGDLLHLSIQNNSCTSVILQAGADPNGRNRAGIAHLHSAISPRLCYESIQDLLEAGARPYSTVVGEPDSLYEACARQDLSLTKLLLGEHFKAETNCLAYKTSLVRSLGKASSLDDKPICVFLVGKGAETGLWSHTIDLDHAKDEASINLMIEDHELVGIIRSQAPQVHVHADSKNKLTLQFKRWLQRDFDIAFRLLGRARGVSPKIG